MLSILTGKKSWLFSLKHKMYHHRTILKQIDEGANDLEMRTAPCPFSSFILISVLFVPALYWYCPGYFICLFIFGVPFTRSYFIWGNLKNFKPLNLLQNQIKVKIILFWKQSVICNCDPDRGTDTLILSPLLWVHIFSVKSDCQSCIPRNQIKINVSCS